MSAFVSTVVPQAPSPPSQWVTSPSHAAPSPSQVPEAEPETLATSGTGVADADDWVDVVVENDAGEVVTSVVDPRGIIGAAVAMPQRRVVATRILLKIAILMLLVCLFCCFEGLEGLVCREWSLLDRESK